MVLKKETKHEKTNGTKNRKQRRWESNPDYLHVQATPWPLHHSDTLGLND